MKVSALLPFAVRLMQSTVFAALGGMTTVHAADAPLFAAPTADHAATATGAGSIGQVTLALVVVLAFVFVAAWAMRYLRKLNMGGSSQQLQIVAQVALGAKERAVLIRVNDMQVLVGVAPGQVTALHTFVAPTEAHPDAVAVSEQTTNTNPSAAPGVPSFQALLKKSLGMS